jgi:hypothetical protein
MRPRKPRGPIPPPPFPLSSGEFRKDRVGVVNAPNALPANESLKSLKQLGVLKPNQIHDLVLNSNGHICISKPQMKLFDASIAPPVRRASVVIHVLAC